MSDPLGARISACVGRVLLGKPEAIELAVTTLLAGGHLLIEDRPGVGKTLLARAIARSLDLPYQRLQCTADLLPVDVIGSQIYQPGAGELRFQPGPVFTSVLVADELNRTPPRTQSALLECMAERSVTIDRTTHRLPDPFFVVATQNPTAGSAGTYPLPDSQLDRFLMRIAIGYPDLGDELSIVAREDGHAALDTLTPVADASAILAARRAVDAVRLQDDLLRYLVELCRRTRESAEVAAGVSSRGAQFLHRASRAHAWLMGRDYVVPDDVQRLAIPVLAHRIAMQTGGSDAALALLTELVHGVPAPV
ncbi:MAG: MoxR family ATPase [Planctomycetes bacterium]|nr:MoxR family ATPase [Planctomycetota bacterium]